MAQEIELKLALPPAARLAFLRQPLLRQALGKPSTERLINIYFDTPDLALHKRRMALRLRKQGRRWLQTVKCAGEVSGGLASRPEWEQPYQGRAFDFSAIESDEVRLRLEKARDQGALQPVFETNFRRRTWIFEPQPGSRLLLTLDEGEIKAGGKSEALCELEIEIAGGSTAPLFALAHALAEKLPLRPDDRSKSERGYRLFSGQALSPVHGQSTGLEANDSARLAFRKLALACLSQLQGNVEGVLETSDPEFIHQMRVALRRLRSALRVFEPALPQGFRQDFDEDLSTLTDILGEARDWDVVLEDLLHPACAALPTQAAILQLEQAAQAAGMAARQKARVTLAAPAYGRLVLAWVAALHGPDFAPPLGTSPDSPLSQFARDRLANLQKRLAKRMERARSLRPEDLHALRIAAKRLRYSLEFFAPLRLGKSAQGVLARMTDLQTQLGKLNDAIIARQRLTTLAAGDEPMQAGLVTLMNWQHARLAPLQAALPDLLAKLPC